MQFAQTLMPVGIGQNKGGAFAGAAFFFANVRFTGWR
jgi:hypothetical protein